MCCLLFSTRKQQLYENILDSRTVHKVLPHRSARYSFVLFVSATCVFIYIFVCKCEEISVYNFYLEMHLCCILQNISMYLYITLRYIYIYTSSYLFPPARFTYISVSCLAIKFKLVSEVRIVNCYIADVMWCRWRNWSNNVMMTVSILELLMFKYNYESYCFIPFNLILTWWYIWFFFNIINHFNLNFHRDFKENPVKWLLKYLKFIYNYSNKFGIPNFINLQSKQAAQIYFLKVNLIATTSSRIITWLSNNIKLKNFKAREMI